MKDDVLYEARVFEGGSYHASMRPEAKPHMINVVDHILKDCAAYNTPKGSARFNELRKELFRIFPEQKDGYISDPVEAMNKRPGHW